MSITFPRDIPTEIKVFRQRFGISVNQSSFTGEISNKKTIQALNNGSSDRWEGVFTINHMAHNIVSKPEEFRILTAFLVSLRGQEGTFLTTDPDREFPSTFVAAAITADSTTVTADNDIITVDSSSFPSNGAVNGSGQIGTIINVDGFSASATILKPGDLFQIETQLYMVLLDVVTNASGQATICFEPAIRISPANNAIVITTRPKMVARLTDTRQIWDSDNVRFGPISFAFEEILNGN